MWQLRSVGLSLFLAIFFSLSWLALWTISFISVMMVYMRFYYCHKAYGWH